MAVGIRASIDGDWAAMMADVDKDIATAATDAAQEVAAGLKNDLRETTQKAGLGGRLANTWRSAVYPKGRASIDAAAFVYSKAPDIIDSFDRGAVIVPVNGSRMLAIPTKNVPRKGRGRRMTPQDVEDAFNQDLKFTRTKDGKIVAYVEVIKSKSGKGWRQATKGRLRQGRVVQPVIMFILIPSARMPKHFDLDATGTYWGQQMQAIFERNLSQL